jgi:hypothetical protein
MQINPVAAAIFIIARISRMFTFAHWFPICSSVRWHKHLKHVGTPKVALELAADIFPVVLRIEPGFRLRQERRDDEIEAPRSGRKSRCIRSPG